MIFDPKLYLNITLKKKWFDMIASGEKKEEYREIKPYWTKRFLGHHNQLNPFFHVIARNGYRPDSPEIVWVHEGIEIGEGKPEWGAEPGKQYFVLKIGELIKK